MQNTIKHVVTGKVRLSYVQIFRTTKTDRKGNPKYSVTVLLPKSDIATKQRIDVAINAAIDDGVKSPKIWAGVRPQQPNICVHDGDGVKAKDGTPYGPECKGHWVFTASTSIAQPRVVDTNRQPLLDQTKLFSGVYALVSVDFAAYNFDGSKGITAYLNNVMVLDDKAEPLGGGLSDVDDDFGSINSPYQAQQPTQYQQPYQPAAPCQQPYQAPTAPPTSPYPQQYNAPAAAPAPAAPAASYPAYQTPATPPYQPQYNAPVVAPAAAPPQVDPITGRPIVGQILGLNN
jgi:hypothetical protein